MSYSTDGKLVIGISSGALFDRAFEEDLFQREGAEAYCRYQRAHEDEILRPGACFELIRSFLKLGPELVEVILMSRNSPDLSLRIYRSIGYYGLHITRSVFVGGAELASYFQVFSPDLFLSTNEEDVREAIGLGIAAGMVWCKGAGPWDADKGQEGELRIALDGDAVIFGEESEAVFQELGLEAFEEQESHLAHIPMSKGPFADFLRKLNGLQERVSGGVGEEGEGRTPGIRIALITARCAPAHERVIRTLRNWGLHVDEIFFLGGMSKKEAARAFGPHIYFDDQHLHAAEVALVAPTARVPGMVTDRRSKRKAYEIQEYRSGTLRGKTQPVYCIGGTG